MPINRPVSAGAIMMEAFSIQLEATWAAVSSSGVRTIAGSRADSAGRGTLIARHPREATMHTTHNGAPKAMASASTAIATAMPT